MASVSRYPPTITAGTLPKLPDDIIFFRIFPLLPIKSLHRFRCISSFCRHLTSDRGFLAAVRLHAPRRYFLSFSASMHWQFDLYSLQESSSSGAAATAHRYRNPSGQCSYATTVNGLTLSVHARQNVVISNFATNEKSHIQSDLKFSIRDRLFFYFCHDPETNTYKVLRTMAIGAYIDENAAVMRYSVFTLGKDSWKNFDLTQLYQLGNSKSVCFNGTLYCTKFMLTGGDHGGGAEVIGAFVLKRERFNAVRYPNGLSPSRYNYCHLIEVKGALAIIDVDDFMCCEVRLWIKGKRGWTEHGIGLDSRWETIFKLSLYYCFSTNREGEIVMGSTKLVPSEGCWIFVYNMENREWRRVEIVGVGEGVVLGNFEVEEYVESPLLLRQILHSSTEIRRINA